MMKTFTKASALVLVGAGLALSACNPTPQPQATPSQPASYPGVTPSGFKLPEGGGCAGDVARYRAIIDNDRDTGHINSKVYDQIQSEIEKAGAACSGGSEGQARGLIQSSRARHGYPAH